MVVIRSMLLHAALVLGLAGFGACLYEDQIGKFDWKRTQIGKLKYAGFDSVKRIVVATEENVVASLSLKNGQVVWRQLLENGRSDRVELLHVDTEVVTVSGDGNTYYVRGWDLNTGMALYDWSLTVDGSRVSRWVVVVDLLIHVQPVVGSHLEVTLYQLRNGGNKDSTVRVDMPWMTELTECVLAEYFWTCKSDEDLISLDLTSDLRKVQRHSLRELLGDAPGKITLHEVRHTEPAVLLRRNNVSRFAKLGATVNVLPYSLEANVISVPNGEQGSLMQLQYVNGAPFDIRSINLQSDESTTVTLDANMNLFTPQLVTGICRSNNCRVLFTSTDNSISLLQMPSGKIQWTREEALGQVMACEFIELPLSERDASIEREFNEASSDVVSMFVRRLSSQARQLSMFLTGHQDSSQNLLVRDDFGLHKLIILATKVGKLFAIDTISGDIIWSRYIPEIVPFNVDDKESMLLYEQRTARYAPLRAEMTFIAKDAVSGFPVMYRFDPISGELLKDKERLNYKIRQVMLLPNEDKSHLRALLIISENNDVHVEPPSAKASLREHQSSLFLFNADPNKGLLTGYTLYYGTEEHPKATPTWNLNLSNSRLVAVSTRPLNERVHSQGRVLADRSVFYKYVNPNLIAAATITDDVLHKHVLSVYLIDGVTGLIVHSTHHKRANLPVHMVHSENWLVYSYFSERFRRFEVTAVELYEGARQSNSTAFSSHALSQLPHPETLSYILPVNPLAMVATLTERGITNKHILMGLSDGAVLEMPWAYLEPRGPHMPSNPEEGYIPYMPELPVQNEATINYNQSLAHIRGIKVSPARLESTSLVVVYGLDLFYTRVMPSKTFDVLKEDFDHWLIVMVLVGLTLASYATKRLSIRKALKQVWK